MARTDNDTWDLASSVGATATMVAAARAIATNADDPVIEDPFAEPLVRAVAVDLRNDWPKALADSGFDETRPTAWIAEGLFGYLPPEAQDRLLDNITVLSADGSRLACEAVPDIPEADREGARELMRKASDKWREHGFDLEFADR